MPLKFTGRFYVASKYSSYRNEVLRDVTSDSGIVSAVKYLKFGSAAKWRKLGFYS